MEKRAVTCQEANLIRGIASKLDIENRHQLLDDLKNARASAATSDGSRILFEITGYERPKYDGQRQYDVEARMLDRDNVELSVLLYCDKNGRLLELEFIRWDSNDLQGPRWESLKLDH